MKGTPSLLPPINVLFATPQCNPFAGAGGLAPIPRELASKMLQTVDPRVDFRIVMPWYHRFANHYDKGGFADLFRIRTDVTDKDRRPYELTIRKGKMESLVETGVHITVYAVFHEELFHGPLFESLPGPGERPPGGKEEAIKFAVFCSAALQMLVDGRWEETENWQPKLIHCQDWQTGLIPVYLRTHSGFGQSVWPGGNPPKTFFTFHYAPATRAQGVFHPDNTGWIPAELLRRCGLDHLSRPPDPGIHHDCDPDRWKNQSQDWSLFNGGVSFVRAGFYYADFASTVSPNYAINEYPHVPWSEGNEGCIDMIRDKWTGIMNGFLYEKYEPLIDPDLINRFTFLSFADPALQLRSIAAPNFVQDRPPNKVRLLEWISRRLQSAAGSGPALTADDGNLSAFRAAFQPEKGLFLSVLPARLASQKGIDIAAEGVRELFMYGDCPNLRVVFMGSPDLAQLDVADAVKRLAEDYPDKVLYINGYADSWERMLIAAADLYLMPSRFEPCGIGQLRGHHYGSVILGSKVGGIVDSVTSVAGWKGNTPETGTAGGPPADGYLFDLAYPSDPKDKIDYSKACRAFADQLKTAYDDFFGRPLGWRELIFNAMRRNHSWDRSVLEYKRIYEEL